jgi:hypothetical protein
MLIFVLPLAVSVPDIPFVIAVAILTAAVLVMTHVLADADVPS